MKLHHASFLVLVLVFVSRQVRAQDPHVTPAPPKTISAAPKTELAAYDVHDLVAALEPEPTNQSAIDAYRARFGLESLSERGASTTPEEDELFEKFRQLEREQRLRQATDALGDLIELHMRPAFDARSQRVNVLNTGSLLVTASKEQHAWVAGFLERQRRGTGIFEIEARFIEVERGAFRVLGDRASWVFASTTEAQAALARVTGSKNDLAVPRVTTRALQLARVESTSEVSYVSDYQLRFVEPGARAVVDPVIDVVHEGIVLKARAFDLADDTIGLGLDAQKSQLKRPMRTVKRRITSVPESEVEVGQPEVQRVAFHADVALAPNGAALFVTADSDDAHDFALLVTIRRASDPAPSTDPGTPAPK